MIEIEDFLIPNIPFGWEIEGNLPPEIWRKIKAEVIPLVPGRLKLFRRADQQAEDYLKCVKRIYFGDAVMLMVPDEISKNGYTTGAVLVSDLLKNPEELKVNMMNTLGLSKITSHKEVKTYWEQLFSMERRAFLAISGKIKTDDE